MDGIDSIASVYSEAKGEYTRQLTLFLTPAFHKFFMSCLQQATEEEANPKRHLWKFQELLSQIPEWNIDKVERETSKLIKDIQCDYLEELIKAVFIAHTKVLIAIRIGNKNKRIQVTIPKLEHFFHRALTECSRLLWSSAYLFQIELSPIEKQKNHRQIEQLLHDGIAQAIRGLLPVKNILKDYLTEPEHDDDADDEEEEEPAKDEKDEKEEQKEEHVAEQPKEEQPKEEQPKEETIQEMIKEQVAPEIPTKDIKDEVTAEVKKEEVCVTEQSKDEGNKPIETIQIPEKITFPTPASLQTPIESPKAERQTLVIQTEPTVQFTDYNQVIKASGNETNISYEHTTHESAEDDEFILEGDGEPVSDFEILDDLASSLDDDDVESLP